MYIRVIVLPQQQRQKYSVAPHVLSRAQAFVKVPTPIVAGSQELLSASIMVLAAMTLQRAVTVQVDLLGPCASSKLMTKAMPPKARYVVTSTATTVANAQRSRLLAMMETKIKSFTVTAALLATGNLSLLEIAANSRQLLNALNHKMDNLS
jgi:hypothetical protein